MERYVSRKSEYKFDIFDLQSKKIILSYERPKKIPCQHLQHWKYKGELGTIDIDRDERIKKTIKLIQEWFEDDQNEKSSYNCETKSLKEIKDFPFDSLKYINDYFIPLRF